MVFDIVDIMKILPHRHPFLMIDRVLEASNRHAVALKNVTMNEPYFSGHFSGNSIVPGVLLSESVLQTCAFIGQSVDQPAGDAPASGKMICVAMNTKFRAEVVPGDTLHIETKLIKTFAGLAKMSGQIKVNGEVVMNGDFSLKKIDRRGYE